MPILAVPLLMIGVSVKQSSIIVLPFVLFYLAKRYGARKAAIGLVLGIGLWAALAAPYLLHDGGRISLERIFKASFRSCPQTLAGFLFFPYQLASRLSPALMAFRPRVIWAIGLVLALGFVAFYLRLLVLRLRGPYGPAKLLYDSVLVQFVLVCFVSVKFYPWYLGMFLPLAYWLPRDDKLRRVVLAVSCAQVFQFTSLRGMNGLSAVVLLLGPAAYGVMSEAGRRRFHAGLDSLVAWVHAKGIAPIRSAASRLW